MARPLLTCQSLELHAIGRGGEFLKVLDNLGPTGELSIVTGREAEDVSRGGDSSGLSEGSTIKAKGARLSGECYEEKRGTDQRSKLAHWSVSSLCPLW